MKIGRLLLRFAVGGFFFGHGTQKLFGWFDGHGMEATGQMFEQLGMKPGRRNALAAGIAESAGGAGIALGFATPLAAAAVTSVMLTAINRVHLKNGPWVTSGGYEYNVVLIAAALALTEVGPGEHSLDHALGLEHTGPGWALAALGLGAAGAAGAHQAAKAYSASHPSPVTEEPAPPAGEAPSATEASAPTAVETPSPTEASAPTEVVTPSAPTEAGGAGTAQ